MSTSKRKKAARQEQQRKEKIIRQYEKKLAAQPKKEKQFKEYQPKETYVRETPYIPSFKSSTPTPDSTGRREAKRYTGTLVKGIATMHKSNAVPVISQQEAEDISKMRRG